MADPSVAAPVSPATHLDAEERFLGRAVVCSCQATRLEVRLPDGRQVQAKLAVPFGYRPQVDDELVVIGQQDRYFVIGVTEAANAVELRFSGDVELRSTHGNIHLNAAKKLQMMAADIDMRTKVLTVISDKIVEKATTVYQRVSELLSIRAGEKQEVVDGECSTRAEHIHLASREVVKVNGKEIHLG